MGAECPQPPSFRAHSAVGGTLRLFDDCEAERQTSAPDQPQVAGGEEPLAVEDNCELWGVYISYDGGYSWALMFTYWFYT